MTRPEIGTTQLAEAAGRPGLRGDGAPSPYHRPIIKEPVWTWEIPFYLYTGGLAGASAALAYSARLSGNDVLARRAWAAAIAGVTASPVFLISDLGKPSRFYNMLRVFKVTSPMSVGSWILAASGAAFVPPTLNAWTGLLPRTAKVAGPVAAALGLPLSTYTAALLTDTAVPAWHQVRHVMPFVFGASACASAGAAAVLSTPADDAAPARRMLVAGALAEVVLTQVMESRSGRLEEAYSGGAAGKFGKASKALSVAGAAVTAWNHGRSRALSVASAALVTGGAVCSRWSVFKAGSQSAADPSQTVTPQRERIRSGATRGAARKAAR